MRPLVEATVADETGAMKATFFNQPWLVQRYPAGTRLVLHGKFEARSRFRVQGHARTSESTGGASGAEAVAHYPATVGLSSTQILALVQKHSAALGDELEPLPSRLRYVERLPDRAGALGAAHFPDLTATSIWAAGGWPSRSCCSCSSPSCGAAGCGARSESRRCSTATTS